MATKRARYPAWIYRQSAALPYRWQGQDLEVLLITSRRGKRWVLPKGIIEPGLTAGASAAKEALEEAGIEGDTAEDSLGTYRQRKWGGTCRVEVYPFRVRNQLTDWPESEIRSRRWLPAAAAARRVEDPDLRQIIARISEVAQPAEQVEITSGPQDLPNPPSRLIYAMRHAKSSKGDPNLEDYNRPLTAPGRRDSERMQRYIALGDIKPDLVLCSPALRASQTLEEVMAALGARAMVEYDPDLYLATPEAMLDRLRRTADNLFRVMIVGHNPGMQGLVSQLAAGGDEAGLAKLQKKYPTGALATLVVGVPSWSDLATGTCDLHSLVAPADIAEEPSRARRD